MKPDPWPLLTTTNVLGVEPDRAVLIGDSVTDIEAGHAVGMPCIACANKLASDPSSSGSKPLPSLTTWEI